ncbi:hypothetical protein FTV88_3241 [Heliorestis convoluta]|uniref:Uncharacterized protein n=1 Tax=Heliorestis convoluta TaxID=356322 RepID=A0A5Q2N3C3_9FIRM|nr:hypothetical protein FTV88_3241 [Heliorestis convoluta]
MLEQIVYGLTKLKEIIYYLIKKESGKRRKIIPYGEYSFRVFYEGKVMLMG